MKTYIWPIYLRIFHWLLVISFISAFILSDFKELRSWHAAFGILAGSLIAFRIVYGLIGGKHAHFKDFPIGLNKQIAYFKDLKEKRKVYAGHNPQAASVMLAILVVGLITSCTGFLYYGGKKKIITHPLDSHLLEELHEVFAQAFFILVILHVLGLIIDRFLKPRNKTLLSMITGYKQVNGTSVTPNAFQKVYGFLWIVIPVIIFTVSLSKFNQSKASKKVPPTEQHDEHNEDH